MLKKAKKMEKTKKFNVITIASSYDKSAKIKEVASTCFEFLTQKGIEVQVHETLRSVFPKKYYCTNKKIIEKSKLIISIGGDGTMLGLARDLGSKGIPILGINSGQIGFLSDVDPDSISKSLTDIINGKYIQDSRSFLEAYVKDSISDKLALNEIVIHSGSVASMIEFDLFVDENFVYTLRADGIIISTTTGSTAYSLSAGGPVIHPDLDLISVVPMFPHSLSASPFLVGPNSPLKIIIKNNVISSKISFDSSLSLKLKKNQEINIYLSRKKLKLIHPLDHDFFNTCRNKLGWSKGIIQE